MNCISPNKPCFLHGSLTLLVLGFLACSNPVQQKTVVEPAPLLVAATPIVAPVNTDLCLSKWTEANAASGLDLQQVGKTEFSYLVESASAYPDTIAFLNKLKIFAEALAPESECHKSIVFRITKDSQYFYKANLQLSDVDQYNQQIISWPELVRRMQFAEEASVTTIQHNLKAARLQGDLSLATKWVQQWLSQEADNAQAQLIFANILSDQKKYIESLNLYQKVLDKDPKNEVALYNQAHTFAESGQLDLAIAAWQNLITNFSQYHFKTITLDMLQLRLLKNFLQDQKLDLASELLLKITTPSFDKDILAIHLLRAQKDFVGAELKNASLLASAALDRPLILYNMVVLEMDLKNKSKAQIYYDELKSLDADLAKDFFFLDNWQDEIKSEDADATVTTP